MFATCLYLLFLGNLLDLSPYDERQEKTKLLVEQQQEECEKILHEEEQERIVQIECDKQREKRQNVLQELVITEKDYLFDLHLCMNCFLNSSSTVEVCDNS